MSKMNISRSIEINVSIDEVYAQLNQFADWRAWSPWLIMEPEAKLDISSDAKYYEWEGSRVGSGNMKVVDEQPNSKIEYELYFLKPWKSFAKVKFELQELNTSIESTHDENHGLSSTRVTWSMESNLPFFMFFMKSMMEAFVGSDYERGLAMLKVYLETGNIPFSLEFSGETRFGGCRFIAIKNQCDITDVGNKMKNDFDVISSYIENYPELVNGPAFSIYHDWNLVKGSVAYTSGVPVNNIPSDLPSNFETGEIAPIQVYKVIHKGPYQYLGNAWSTIYAMERNKEFKKNKHFHPFELYLNNPMDVSENELITEICFPVK